MTIAHRKAIDVTRAAARRRRPADELPDTGAPAAPAEGRDLDLAAALNQLPPKQKQAVAYHYLAGLPYAEVAAIVGGTAAAARRASADGIAALRRSFRQPQDRRCTMNVPHEDPDLARALALAAPVTPIICRRCTPDWPPRPRPTASWTSPIAPSTPRSARCCWRPPTADWSASPTPARTTTPCCRASPTGSVPASCRSPARLDAVARELEEYFAGQRRSFDVPLDWRLSAGFRASVLHHLATDLAYGQHRQLQQGRPARRQPEGRPRRRHRLRHQPAARRRSLPPRRARRRLDRALPRRHRRQTRTAHPGSSGMTSTNTIRWADRISRVDGEHGGSDLPGET